MEADGKCVSLIGNRFEVHRSPLVSAGEPKGIFQLNAQPSFPRTGLGSSSALLASHCFLGLPSFLKAFPLS